MSDVGTDYEYLKKKILAITGVDLNAYKENQMKRRLDTLIRKHGFKDYVEYCECVRTDKDIKEEFLGYMTINVSEFYRNPDQWEFLDKTVIPELIKRFGKNLKIWSAACSTGDEPYSLVMALSRHLPLNMIKIYATDIDNQILAQAKNGIYSDKSIKGVPADLLEKYFEKVGTSYKIKDEIKSRVEFKQANLLDNNYPKGFNMIVCRNVLIYFTEEAKDNVFRRFHDSLVQGGVLFIGSTEQIVNYRDMDYSRKNSFFYERN
ncbi:MAG: protein-glutamate O-methyltransferase CheR [Lachnospiraceae bacterium]|nr:protein-glutamate O-methyltransferase CheR [Lachnospiraceae bacterium]